MSGEVAGETERLILRNFRDADSAAYAELCGDPEVMRHLGGPLPAEHAVAEMAAISRSFEESGFGMLAVERKLDGAFVGMCGLSVERWYSDDLQIGWRLLPRYWGEGYATEAAMFWRDLAFAAPVPRLISISDVPNQRSHRVMERLGMQRHETGTFEMNGERFEAHIYALTRDQWAAR